VGEDSSRRTGHGFTAGPHSPRSVFCDKWRRQARPRRGSNLVAAFRGPVGPGADSPVEGDIYLHLWGKPGGELELAGLKNEVKRAYLLAGCEQAVACRRNEAGSLVLQLPATLPDPDVSVVAIELDAPPVVDTAIRQQADGSLVLRASEAIIHGTTPQYESGGGKDNIGYWANPQDYVSWDFELTKPGVFTVEISYSCASGCEGSQYTVEAGGQTLTGTSPATGSWSTFTTEKLGTLTFDKPGRSTLAVKPKANPKWKVIGLKSVRLTP
jgi:alpha-L-fucosidase